VSELSKVSQFYAEKAQDLESILANRDLAKSSDELNQLRVEVQVRGCVCVCACALMYVCDVGAQSSPCNFQELIKFVALNYLAVVKAIKKRNKALKVKKWHVIRVSGFVCLLLSDPLDTR
jgi:hypothetical protein